MKKCLIAIILILCMIPLVSAIENCEETVEPSTVCLVLTPTIPCNTTAKIFNNTDLVRTSNMTLLNDSIYYFNFSEVAGSYIIQLCDNSTREIIVEREDDMSFVIGLVAIAFLFFYFAFHLDKDHFLLKIILIFLGLITIMLIPAALINDTIAMQTSLLKVTTWAFRIFLIYFTVYLFYHWAKKSDLMLRILGKNR